jgi:hypothetical protein
MEPPASTSRNVQALLEHCFLSAFFGCLGLIVAAILSVLFGYWLVLRGWSEQHATTAGTVTFVVGLVAIAALNLMFWSLLVPDEYRKKYLLNMTLAAGIGLSAPVLQWVAGPNSLLGWLAVLLGLVAIGLGFRGFWIFLRYGSAPPR